MSMAWGLFILRSRAVFPYHLGMYSEPQPSAARLDRELTQAIADLREARRRHVEMPSGADAVYRTRIEADHAETERRVIALIKRKDALGYYTRGSRA
jgi:hypothetical protein